MVDPDIARELRIMESSRDEQRRMGGATSESWCDLSDRAQCLFRTCRIPFHVFRLLIHILGAQHLISDTETIMARVLAHA